ncbi:MAG: peptide ABC transporter substrate-binding protein [Candidatus Gracilibacteria bacterium]
MELIIRTLKSFSRKEKWFLLGVSPIFFGSLIWIILTGLFSFGNGRIEVYSEGLVGQIIHLNPVFTEFSNADADVSSLIFSGLVKYNAVTGTFDEDLATHTLSEDHLTYTFTLKNNIYWQDGVELTADDIYYTFAEVIQSEDFKNALLKANFAGVTIEEQNTRTITFTLNSPNSFFFTALTVGILPKHILGDTAVADLDTHPFNQNPIGTGPYKVDGPYEVDDEGITTVNLSLNPSYYGDKPGVEKIRFIAYPGLESLLENRSTWHGASQLHQDVLSTIDTSDLVTYQYELPQYTALFFNTDSPFLNKNKTRLGISKAIDKEEILSAIGFKVAIDTPLLELDQKEWIHTFNANEAAGALHDGGWGLKEGDTYRTNEDGETLSIRLVRRDFADTNPLQENVTRLTAEMIQSQLKGIGVELTIEAYSKEELNDIIASRDYDMLLYGQSLGYNLDTFSFFHSSQATETGYNLSNYQNPVADIAIEQIRTTFDQSERDELLNDLAEIIATDVPAIFLYTPSYYYAVDKRATGISFQKLLLPRDRFSNIAEWKIN